MPALLKADVKVAVDPLAWLARGWSDLRVYPRLSLSYGAVILLAGALICALLSRAALTQLIPAALAAFAFAGPVLAGGLYEISRKIETGAAVTFSDLMGKRWLREGTFVVGLILMFAVLAWMRIALVLVELFFADISLSLGASLHHIATTPQGYLFLATGSLIGAVFTVSIFAISAYSVPMIIDREIDALTAMKESVKLVLAHPVASALWAALIGAFLFASAATALFGLVLAFPLIGHASWHAYRSLTADRPLP